MRRKYTALKQLIRQHPVEALTVADLVLLAVLLRVAFYHTSTPDYTVFFKPWSDHLAQTGLAGLKDASFANYNTPYLLILWLGTHLSLSTLTFIKLVSGLFDGVMAVTVYLIVREFRPRGKAKLIAALATFWLPTVIINSSWWGQCDSIYTAWLLLTFYACLRGRANLAWGFWGVALAFKLQAIFLLPFLLFWTISRRERWTAPLYAAWWFLLLSIAPLLEGAGISSLWAAYTSQAHVANLGLSFNAPTIYTWLPASAGYQHLGVIQKVGQAVTALAVLIYLWPARRRRHDNKHTLLVYAALSCFLVTFLLPGMHERYFYPAEIFSLLLIFDQLKLAWIAPVMQVVTIIAYIPFMTYSVNGTLPNEPFALLAGLVALIVVNLVVTSRKLLLM
jgi:Gpi18-like mannosyltransferase